MSKASKASFLLLFSISLPILLLILVWVIPFIPKHYTKPPEYDLIYMTSKYPQDGISIEVVDNKIRIWISEEAARQNRPLPRFFRYDAKADLSFEIKVPPASKVMSSFIKMNKEKVTKGKKEVVVQKNPKEKKELIVSYLQKIRVNPKSLSSDGYKAEFTRSSNATLSNLLLFSDYKNSLTINKKYNTILVVKEGDYDSNTIQFLGWIDSK